MSKGMSVSMYDSGLNLTANCTGLSVLSGSNTTIWTSVAQIRTAELANTTISFSDFVFGTSGTGRYVEMQQKGNIPIANTGTATHVAIYTASDFVVTTCTSQVLTQGGTVTVPNWKREIAFPS